MWRCAWGNAFVYVFVIFKFSTAIERLMLSCRYCCTEVRIIRAYGLQ